MSEANDRRPTAPPTAEPPAAAERPDSVRRILGAVGIALAVVHVTQAIAGEYALAGVLAFAGVAGWLVGWRRAVLRSVRTAVVLLVLLSIACVLATLTVQRSHLTSASDEDFRGTVEFAWAHLLIKITHPLPGDVELGPAFEQRMEQLEAAFGADHADEQREKQTKGAAAARDERAAQELVAAHPAPFDVAYRFANALRLTDAFRAWWFVALFYVLSLNLVLGALVRRKPSVRNLGFHGAHLGLVLIVIGATGGAFLSERGFVPLTVGDASSTYRNSATGSEAGLGYSIRLDEFETLYHEDLTVTVGSDGAAMGSPHHGMGGSPHGPTLQRTVKLEEGATFDVAAVDGDPAYTVTIEEIGTAFGTARGYVASDEPDARAAARITLSAEDAEGAWLGGRGSLFIDPDNRFKVRVTRAADDPGAGCGSDAPMGTLTLRTGAGAEPVEVPAVPGHTQPVGPLTVTIVEVIPDFTVGGPPPRPTDFPRNPALRASIGGDGAEATPYLFFADPDLRSFTQLPWDGAEGAFEFDFWCAPTAVRVDLQVDASGGVTAHVERAAGEDGEPPPVERVPLTSGEPLALAGLDASLTVLEAIPAAVEQVERITERPAAMDEAMPALTAARLVARGGDGDVERWLLSNTTAGVMTLGRGDDTITIQLADNRQRPPRDWRSHVSVLEEGAVVGGGPIEVNEPFCYRGYCFFQSDADASRPEYSGLQVVRDPSWPPVHLGLWMLLLGISWCFYVQPLFDRAAARRRSQAAPPATGEREEDDR